MEATLLIYSGRPNPRWRVDEARARELLAAIAALPEAKEPAPAGGGLGYSGVALDFTDESGAPRHAVFARGRAVVDGRAHVDAGRAVERALLATGGPEMAELAGFS